MFFNNQVRGVVDMIRIFDGRAMAELVIEESAFEGVTEIVGLSSM